MNNTPGFWAEASLLPWEPMRTLIGRIPFVMVAEPQCVWICRQKYCRWICF